MLAKQLSELHVQPPMMLQSCTKILAKRFSISEPIELRVCTIDLKTPTSSMHRQRSRLYNPAFTSPHHPNITRLQYTTKLWRNVWCIVDRKMTNPNTNRHIVKTLGVGLSFLSSKNCSQINYSRQHPDLRS